MLRSRRLILGGLRRAGVLAVLLAGGLGGLAGGSALLATRSGTGLTADDLARAWGAAAIQSRDAGLVHYLFPPDLSAWAPRSPYTVRALSLADDDGMQALHAACSPAEVDDGYVEVSHEIAFGCFADGALVATSSLSLIQISEPTRPY